MNTGRIISETHVRWLPASRHAMHVGPCRALGEGSSVNANNAKIRHCRQG